MPKARVEPVGSEILNVNQAASVLGLGVGALYRLAKNGKLPGTKVGDSWRFSRAGLEEWVKNEGEKNLK